MLLTVLNTKHKVSAAETTTRIYSNDFTIYQNGGAYIDIYIENATAIGALELSIQLDDKIITGGHYVGSLLSNELYDLNKSNPGEIKVSITSLNGMNGQGHLFSIHIQVPYDFPLGDSFFTITVSEVYDINFNPVQVKGSTHKMKVLERQTSTRNGYIYDSASDNNLKLGQTFQYGINGYNLNQLVAGEINIQYDRTVLKPVKTTLNGHFNISGSIYSLNDSLDGQIKLAFAFDTSIDYLYSIVVIDFEVIQDTDVSSSIQTELVNAYSSDLQSISFSKTSQTINISKSPVVVDYPNLYTTTYAGSATNEFTIDVMIDQNSLLAAGDFVLNYNLNHLSVVSIAPGSNVSTNGGIIMFNPVYDQGQIKFTYINENGLTTSDVLLKVTFKPKYDNFNLQTELTLSQSGDLVDKDFKTIVLEYIKTTITLYEVKTYRFLNPDGSEYTLIKADVDNSIDLPKGPDRPGTIFKSWVLESDTNNIATYKPAYTLLEESITLDQLFKVYDGQSMTLNINTTVLGVTYQIKGQQPVNPGTYDIEIDVFLDDEYQFTLEEKIYILSNIETISLETKDIIQTYRDIYDHLSESDQALLQSVIDEAITNYDTWVESMNNEYVIADKIKSNLNYFIVVSVLQSILGLYYWRKRS